MKPEYNAVMAEFSNDYYEYTSGISLRLREMSDDELAFLWEAANSVTTTNCWFATYQVAQLIKERIQRVPRERRLATESADFRTEIK